MLNRWFSVAPAPPTRRYVWVSVESSSTVLNSPTVVPTSAFSGSVEGVREMSAGTSFTSNTLIANAFSTLRPLSSVERTLTVREG